jgi:hypothetical protein
MQSLRLNIFGIILILVLILSLGAASFFYFKADELKKNDPKVVAEIEIKDTVEKVSKLILLPTDEEPTVATVTNLEDLKDQPFFTNAKVGYKVLIYTKAKKAILYDPERNILVEVAPLSLDR